MHWRMSCCFPSQGLSEKAALEAIYMVDTKGLITATRPGKLPAHKARKATSSSTLPLAGFPVPVASLC